MNYERSKVILKRITPSSLSVTSHKSFQSKSRLRTLLSLNMAKPNSEMLKLSHLNGELFNKLKEKTQLLKKEKMEVKPLDELFGQVNIEQYLPIIFHNLKHKYNINPEVIEAKVFNKQHVPHSLNTEHNETRTHVNTNKDIKEESKLNEWTNYEKPGKVDFLQSLVHLNIPVLQEYEQVRFFKHIIEFIDLVAAETVYRHSVGTYREGNNNFHFVTALFNNLKIYKKSDTSHEFNFSLNPKEPLTINSYIAYAGTTSYILKIDFYQNNALVFDLFSTFVNISTLTFKPQQVPDVYNFNENVQYMHVRNFAKHLKCVQHLFNHKDVKQHYLHQKDIEFVKNYFKDIRIEEKEHIPIVPNQVCNLYEEESKKKKNTQSENILSITNDIIDTNNVSFYIGSSNFYCKQSYVESKYFITSEFKNIHNFTFGGYLAYLSFCHGMVIVKNFIKKPVLIALNEIQYILPVPYNDVVLYKGKVVYCDEQEIEVKICAYYYDTKKKEYSLTTTFDLSFQNNDNIAFIPETDEEIKFFLLGYLRTQLLP